MPAEQKRTDAELRTTSLALAHYRKAYELEQGMTDPPPTQQPSDPTRSDDKLHDQTRKHQARSRWRALPPHVLHASPYSPKLGRM
jgi:hypothetical protein